MIAQTAVEWFAHEINKINASTEAKLFIEKLKNQAIEMEKEQIIKATVLDLCWEYPMIAKEKEAAEKYYNDTYKTELHDK